MSEHQKFHCVTQLQEDSWEYRLKRPDDPPNDDDLVSWTDYLEMHDRLLMERDAWDKRRVADIEQLRMNVSEWKRLANASSEKHQSVSKKLTLALDCLEEVLPDLFPDLQARVRRVLEEIHA